MNDILDELYRRFYHHSPQANLNEEIEGLHRQLIERLGNEKLFIGHITRKNTVGTRQEITRIQREIDATKRRDGELTTLFKRLYEDNVLGRIPNEHFRLLSSEYTTEQAQLRERLPKLEQRLEQVRNSLTNVAQFTDKAKRYSDITELTPEIPRLFVETIVVSKSLRSIPAPPSRASRFITATSARWTRLWSRQTHGGASCTRMSPSGQENSPIPSEPR